MSDLIKLMRDHAMFSNEHTAHILREGAEALEKEELDAARYRWLRDRPAFIGWDWWNPYVPNDVNITPEFMDAAIDTARKEGT
jgi:hypothetical protein